MERRLVGARAWEGKVKMLGRVPVGNSMVWPDVTCFCTGIAGGRNVLLALGVSAVGSSSK